MATTNPITGDELATGAATEEYKAGHERVFGVREPWYVRRDREAAQAPLVAAVAASSDALWKAEAERLIAGEAGDNTDPAA